jgi:transcriptional antiterminator NusG
MSGLRGRLARPKRTVLCQPASAILRGDARMSAEFIIPSISGPRTSETRVAAFPWYGIRTRSNHEKVAASVLRSKGYDPYLPLYQLQGSQPNAQRQGERPLFPGYVFCRFDVKKRLPVLITTGVISVLGFGKEPAPIPDEEIEAVKAVLRSGLHAAPCAYLREGQHVRVKNGSLNGLEGILVKKKNQYRMVVSVTMLQRSISVEIDGDQLVAL